MSHTAQKRMDQKGFTFPGLIMLMIAMVIITGAAIELIDANFFTVRRNIDSQKAFNIAEAGINYYLWHLSHNATDFKDGQSTPSTPDATLGYGPYVHNYVDDNSQTTGTYTLWINPQGSGSTIVKIRAIGQVAGTNVIRTIDAQIGAPSFASYAVASDSALWFGNNETATGPVHSNQGIRMDGANTADVTSANSTYVPPVSYGGNGSSHPGVWCSTSVTTPINCNTRSKVDWRYPVPSIDFNQVSSSLCTMKKTAFLSDSSTSALAAGANACTQTPTGRTAAYLPQRSTTGTYSISKGYLIELNTNGTYDLSYVNGENDRSTSYSTALTLQSIATGINVPSSGVIFAEDNVWVRTKPTFHGRVTIGAGRLATTNNAEIVVADDIVYTTKNGSDAIGLVAENNITIAPYAPPSSGSFTFEVDGALLAQSGNVYYPDVYRTVNTCTKGWVSSNQQMSYYGSVATRQIWTWSWLQGGGSCGDAVRDNSSGEYISGFLNNNTQYDYNLMYAPPPGFPITSTYNVLSWREVLTRP